MVAEPGVKFAALHYKTLELEKDMALKSNHGNFDSKVCISKESKKKKKKKKKNAPAGG